MRLCYVDSTTDQFYLAKRFARLGLYKDQQLEVNKN